MPNARRTFFHRGPVALLSAMLLLTPMLAQAQTCDPDTEVRLAFLETRLEEGQSKERLWWRSWMGVFTLGVMFSTYQGATRGDGSNSAAAYINAGKSLLGIADLTLRPHVGRHGAERVRAIAKTSPETCKERLQLAERSLEQAADAGAGRWSWKRHLSSLTLNLVAALVVSEGLDDTGTGWRDFGVSEVSSEINIWTHPTRAVDDWSAYRTEFSSAPVAAAPSTFRFAMVPGGVGVRWRF